jgi:hypothetical protein
MTKVRMTLTSKLQAFSVTTTITDSYWINYKLVELTKKSWINHFQRLFNINHWTTFKINYSVISVHDALSEYLIPNFIESLKSSQ